jgi:hypothetical protein
MSTVPSTRADEAGAIQQQSTATSPHSRQQRRPPAHSASWDDGQTSSSAASSSGHPDQKVLAGQKGISEHRSGVPFRSLITASHSMCIAPSAVPPQPPGGRLCMAQRREASYRCSTKVPRPGTVRTRPSSASAWTALRTVIVDKPDSSTRSMMLGIFRPGGYTPVSIRSRRMAANCWNGNSAAS